jgi:hypothetical protein
MANQKNENVIHIEPSLDELAFVNAYFEENMNGTRAYMKLHPKAGYDTARANASETLARTSVRAEVRRRLEEKAMSADEALFRLGEMARAELQPFIRIDNDGFVYFNFKDPRAKEHLYLIKKIKTKRERRIEGKGKEAEEWEGEWVEVELHDAQIALRDILKMHGKFVDKIALTDPTGEKSYDTERTDRALSTLADTLREIISGESGK